MARLKVPKAPPGTTYRMMCGLYLTIDKIKGHSKDCVACWDLRWKQVEKFEKEKAAKKAEKKEENK